LSAKFETQPRLWSNSEKNAALKTAKYFKKTCRKEGEVLRSMRFRKLVDEWVDPKETEQMRNTKLSVGKEKSVND